MKKRVVGFSLSRSTLSFIKWHKSISRHVSFHGLHITNDEGIGGGKQKSMTQDDISLLFTWRKKNTSLYDVFRKESNNEHLYLPASGGTPLVGNLPYGSTDVRNLHEEMRVFSLGVISFISVIKK